MNVTVRFDEINDFIENELDHSIIYNKISQSKNDRLQLFGRVLVFRSSLEDDRKFELVDDNTNLIVYNGREYILNRIFNKNNPNTNSDNKELFISYMSFGNGGAPKTSPLDPEPPTSFDTALNNEIIISKDNVNYADNGKKIPIEVEFLQDKKNHNRFLIAKASATLEKDEAINADINEYGLWLSNSFNPAEAKVFKLFARATKPTLRKLYEFTFNFVWLIYA